MRDVTIILSAAACVVAPVLATGFYVLLQMVAQ
jgi:hypothetical protein